MKIRLLHVSFVAVVFFCTNIKLMAITHHEPAVSYDPAIEIVQKSDKEWSRLLTQEQFDILRKKGTERSGSGKYDKFYETGTYICAACGNPLFSSVTKYDSKTGWPSFWEPLNENSIATEADRSLFFIVRTEVHCNRCKGHLGHVFDDGPKPTGLRYCLNSTALSFISAKKN